MRRPFSVVAKSLLLVTMVAVLAACARAPSHRPAIPGDNDPHPGVNRARALPIQGLDIARYQGLIDFSAALAGGVHFVYM
jgi:lysozyme